MFGTRTGNGLAIAGALLLVAASTPALAQTQDDEPTPVGNLVGEMASPAVDSPPLATDALTPAQPVPVQTQVETLLAGIEHTATAEQWQALGADAIEPLARILGDSAQPVIRRGRAAIGLSYLPSPQTNEALRNALDDAATPKHVRRKSIVALARVEGDSAIDSLSRQLSHRSARVREEAIKAIGGLATRSGQAALRAHAEVERSKYLKKMIQTELARETPTSATGEAHQ